MEEMFIEKPVGKPVKNFRARVKMYGNDVVVVNPMEPRESNRRMIKQKGKSSFYKSEGEKESSYSSRSRGHDAGAVCRTHQRGVEERAEDEGERQVAL